MSAQYFGVGKTYRTAQEAFKEPDYYVAIQRPKEIEYRVFWGFLGALAFTAVFGYCFYLTISRF